MNQAKAKMGLTGSVPRQASLVGVLLALVALLAVVPAIASAAPPTLWQRCDGGEDDISCGATEGVAAAPATSPSPGHVYVGARGAIDEFTPWGEFVRSWGWDVVASGPGNTGTGFEICVPGNGDVCKDGVPGSGVGQFGAAGLGSVAIDSAGNVYVVDGGEPSNYRVQKFDPEGHFLLMWGGDVNKTKVEEGAPEAEQNVCTAASGDTCQAGTQGSGNGQFGWPSFRGGGIAVGPANKIYVGDVGRIQQFSTAGAYQSQVTTGLASTDALRSVAVDSSGTIYAAIEEQADVRKWSSAGAALTSVTASSPRALAVDAAKNLYAITGTPTPAIRKFNSSGAELESWGQEEPPVPRLTFASGIAAGSACLGSGVNIYVANPGLGIRDGDRFLRAYGPAPTKLATCPRPVKAPNIVAQYPLSVGTVEATLQAQIRSRFWPDVTYYAQYASAACIEAEGWEASCVVEKPATPGAALGPAADGATTTTPIPIFGLSPDTEHRFRFVAQSGGGGPVFGLGGKVGEDGPARAFHTAALPLGPPNPDRCSNAPFRTGPSALLPDCRAYEMVSPVDKAGGDIQAFEAGRGGTGSTAYYQSALSGAKLSYSSYQAFGDAPSQPYTVQYIAGRDAEEGWRSHSVSPPRSVAFSPILTQNEREYSFFSPDLCYGWLSSVNKAVSPLLVPGTVEGTFNLYRRSDCGDPGFTALGGGALGKTIPLELQGVSGDNSRAVFASTDHLSQDAAVSVGQELQCSAPGNAKTIAYQWLRESAPIPGKASPSYTTQAADSGKIVQCRVTFSNENTGVTQVANPAWVIAPYPASEPPEAPSVIPAPMASEVLAVASAGGQLLSCDPGEAGWKGSPSFFEVQWFRNGVEIAGAIEASYETSAADLTTPAVFQCEVTATNAGGSVVKTSESILTDPPPNGPVTTKPAARTSINSLASELYESYGDGLLRSVCLLPGSRTLSATCSAGTSKSEGYEGRSNSFARAVSVDGMRIFWSDSHSGPGKIYARIGGVQTIALSNGTAQFLTAATDGSIAVFSEDQDLYRVDVDMTLNEEVGAKELIAHRTIGVVGASEDAKRIYFVSREALTGEEETNSEGAVAEDGAPNLYLFEGGAFTFAGRLSEADVRANAPFVQGPISVEPVNHSARVTPNGEAMAFTSSAPLTGYDNTDAVNGMADTEVYRYEAESGKLDCISCNPSGARPVGRNISADPDRNNPNASVWTAAWISGWPSQLYATRALTDDGHRVFFNSFDPLVLADTNGKQDVYQWEEVDAGDCTQASPSYSPTAGGCVSLLSSGKSPQDSEFIDASASGDDVFIRTASSLVGSDPDQIDIYDARVEGGFPEAAPKPPCEGDACQSPATVPDDPTPASAAFGGAGNVKEAPKARCAKGKMRRSGRCVAKKKKRHASSKRPRASAKRGGQR